MDHQVDQPAPGLEHKLIINYLPQSLSDEEFHSIFLSIGPISSSKIIRDKSTNYSYGFGFIEYQNPVDASRAIESLNGLKLQNKTLKVAFSRPGGDNIKGANLYITNIPKHWSDQDLKNAFLKFGNVIQARLLIDHTTNMSKGVGFVLFDQKSQADIAMKSMNGSIPEGGSVALTIKKADDNAKKVRAPVPPMPLLPPAGRNLAGGPIRNMPNNRFPRYNPMGQGSMRNQSYGGSMGAGMYDAAGYDQSYGGGMSTQRGSMMKQADGAVLYVYNIGNDATEKVLYQLFSPYGNVTKVNVIYDSKKGQCKGYGFVTMSSWEEADSAIYSLNGYWYNGRELQVSYHNK